MIAHLISQKEYSMETGGSVLAAALGFVNGESKIRADPYRIVSPTLRSPPEICPPSCPKQRAEVRLVSGLNRLFPWQDAPSLGKTQQRLNTALLQN